MSNRDVRIEHVRQLYRALGEAGDTPSPQTAQTQMLRGICRILNARVATSGLITGLNRGAFEIGRSECVGVSGSEAAQLFAPYASHGANGDPLLRHMLALPRTAEVRVHRRRELVSDADWHGDAFVADVRTPLRLDDTIHAYKACGSGAVIGFQIVRDAADGSFDERDRNLVELLIVEAGARLAPRASPGIRPLTQREQQTL